ncbi:MAG: CRISPR system precrRNA processing endoribonuclease RAMP protein Cas6 [Candidatus Heimdallarchaeota archaeon]|nr:CRISPR system precrRNA processing endoribonuclease RAMP protein Cas6 [Candidatus Heimdallarchaeota archaeon]
MTNIYKLTFVLRNKEKALLPAYTGHIIRGAVLAKIREEDKELSEELHKSNKIRPYRLSPLLPYKSSKFHRTRRGEIKLPKNFPVIFQMGILHQRLAQAIIKIMLEQQNNGFSLIKHDFSIEKIEIETKTAIDLLKNGDLPANKFKIIFHTPTYFNISKQPFPLRFPDPRYLFMNLASIWNAFNTKAQINKEEFYNWLENNLSVSGFELKTRTAYISKGAPKIGCQGWVHYRLSKDETYNNWVPALALFGETSNVGGGRTAGFGCIEFEPR